MLYTRIAIALGCILGVTLLCMVGSIYALRRRRQYLREQFPTHADTYGPGGFETAAYDQLRKEQQIESEKVREASRLAQGAGLDAVAQNRAIDGTNDGKRNDATNKPIAENCSEDDVDSDASELRPALPPRPVAAHISCKNESWSDVQTSEESQGDILGSE